MKLTYYSINYCRITDYFLREKAANLFAVAVNRDVNMVRRFRIVGEIGIAVHVLRRSLHFLICRLLLI